MATLSKIMDGIFYLLGLAAIILVIGNQLAIMWDYNSERQGLGYLYVIGTLVGWTFLFILAKKVRDLIKPDYIISSGFIESIKIQLGYQYLPLILTLGLTIQYSKEKMSDIISEEKNKISKEAYEKKMSPKVFITNDTLWGIEGVFNTFKIEHNVDGVMEFHRIKQEMGFDYKELSIDTLRTEKTEKGFDLLSTNERFSGILHGDKIELIFKSDGNKIEFSLSK